MIKKILVIVFIILEIYLLSYSRIVIDDFNKTLSICMYNLMPTIFFSCLFNNIFINLEIYKYIPKKIINFFKRLFNINSNEVIIFLLSIISGYPNNSKMLENNKNLNKIIQYTNFINPLYFIGTVGNIYLKNIKLTLIIYFSHVISNIILGIILRKKDNYKEKITIKKTNDKLYTIYFNSLKQTINVLINIFTVILSFSILLSLINNILPNNYILNGIIEFSSGIYKISNININNFIKGLLILIIITFSSFSVHMQIININEKINYKLFLFYRIINILLSIIIYFIIYNLLMY